MVDLLVLIELLESGFDGRRVVDSGGDFAINLLNSWYKYYNTYVKITINSGQVFKFCYRVDLIPVNNIINIYVWYEVGGSPTFSVFSLDEVSSFVIV